MAKGKKVKVSNYILDNASALKVYKSIEHLKVIRRKGKRTSDFFKNIIVCTNQFGEEIEKSEFMIRYAYSKNKKGYLVPLHKKQLIAIQVQEDISFNSTQGEATNLVKGDYVVIDRDYFYGQSKEEFEKNYMPKREAIKFNKSFNESHDATTKYDPLIY